MLMQILIDYFDVKHVKHHTTGDSEVFIELKGNVKENLDDLLSIRESSVIHLNDNNSFEIVNADKLKLLLSELHDIKKNFNIETLNTFKGKASVFKVLLSEIIEIKNAIKNTNCNRAQSETR